jgi:hypothetical protein
MPILAETTGLRYLIVILAMQTFFPTIILFIVFILCGCDKAGNVCCGFEVQVVVGN